MTYYMKLPVFFQHQNPFLDRKSYYMCHSKRLWTALQIDLIKTSRKVKALLHWKAPFSLKNSQHFMPWPKPISDEEISKLWTFDRVLKLFSYFRHQMAEIGLTAFDQEILRNCKLMKLKLNKVLTWRFMETTLRSSID